MFEFNVPSYIFEGNGTSFIIQIKKAKSKESNSKVEVCADKDFISLSMCFVTTKANLSKTILIKILNSSSLILSYNEYY